MKEGDEGKFRIVQGGSQEPKGVKDLPTITDPVEIRGILDQSKRNVLRPLIAGMCGVILADEDLDRISGLMEEMFFTKGAADRAREQIKEDFPAVAPFVDVILGSYGKGRHIPTQTPEQIKKEVANMAEDRRVRMRQAISEECHRIMTDGELDRVWQLISAIAINPSREGDLKQLLVKEFPGLEVYIERLLREQKELHEED